MPDKVSLQEKCVLLTAYELGIFSALGGKNKGAGEVAQALRLPQESTEA